MYDADLHGFLPDTKSWMNCLVDRIKFVEATTLTFLVFSAPDLHSAIMGMCMGCGLDFQYFYGETCQKCVKRADAKSEMERGAVEVRKRLIQPRSLLTPSTEAAAMLGLLCHLPFHET